MDLDRKCSSNKKESTKRHKAAEPQPKEGTQRTAERHRDHRDFICFFSVVSVFLREPLRSHKSSSVNILARDVHAMAQFIPDRSTKEHEGFYSFSLCLRAFVPSCLKPYEAIFSCGSAAL